jgi:hypothetical protein
MEKSNQTPFAELPESLVEEIEAPLKYRVKYYFFHPFIM